jgi:hypothetical protein
MSTTSNAKCLIPIVIGVTGHQDIRPQDIAVLEDRVRSIITEIKNDFPESPIVLLSPLAEGADRLVARVALSMGNRLLVPLPMALEEYKRDFNSPASLEEFNSLVDAAEDVFEISIGEEESRSTLTREILYSRVGLYVAHHSHILIALWNGQDSQLLGGTSTVVHYKIHGTPVSLAANPRSYEQVECGPVYHVMTPRAENVGLMSDAFGIKKLYPPFWGDSKLAELNYSGIFASINEYNRDILAHTLSTGGSIATEDDRASAGGPGITIDPQFSNLNDRFTAADAVATAFKSLRIRTIVGLLSLVVVAFFFFHFYLEFYHHALMLIVYPVFLTAATLWYFFARRRKYDQKHEDYRALAEAMRIQLFWKIVDIQDNAADYYLRKHRGELGWIRYALRVSSLSLRGKKIGQSYNSDGEFGKRFVLVVEKWVKEQHRWFTAKSIESHAKSARLEKTANLFFLLGLLSAITMFAIEAMQLELPFLSHAMTLVVLMTLAFSGVLHGYKEKMVFSEEAKQYSRMADFYELAISEIQKLNPDDYGHRGIAILKELGKEALAENGDWLLLHRSRPMEIPRI